MINKVKIVGKVKKILSKVDNSGNSVINIEGDISELGDSYHTTDELYAHRVMLFIALMKLNPSISWKSKHHHDESFYEGWFIAGMDLPSGTISYHIPENFWDMISSINTLDKAPEWDGYTSNDVIKRLNNWCLIL